jgi:NADPH-dependent glutamate synthase beta subunit-like oxidoreductase
MFYVEKRNFKRNNRRNDNVKYENIEVVTKDFGNNNFVEVVKRKAIVEKEGGEIVENVFVQVTRGFYTPEGEKRYKSGQRFSVPVDELNTLIDALKELQ